MNDIGGNTMSSFKTRVENFWKGFSEEESIYRNLIDEKRFDEVRESVNALVDDLNLAFEIGGANNKYELVLTGEGNKTKCILANYCIKNVLTELLEKWNFHSTRPRMSEGFSIKMFDTVFASEDFIIYPKVDVKKEKVDIEIYSSKLAKLSNDDKYRLVFIYLDTMVGENYVESYLGGINILNSKKLLAKGINIGDVFQYIEDTIAANKWKKYNNPCEIFSGYQGQPNQESKNLRDDVFVGYTACFDVINHYYSDNEWFEQVEDCGFTYGFLYYNNDGIENDNLVVFRGEIEDKIMALIDGKGIAESIGGATGINNSYIDFIIFDEADFIENIKNVDVELEGLCYRRFSNSSSSVKIV